MQLSERVVSTHLGLLIRSARPSDQGLYSCLTTENAFKRTAAKIRLKLLSNTEGRRPPPPPLPQDLLAAFSPAESLAAQQYCQERAELKKLKQRVPAPPPSPAPLRGDLARLKPLLDRRRSRHRRHQAP